MGGRGTFEEKAQGRVDGHLAVSPLWISHPGLSTPATVALLSNKR